MAKAPKEIDPLLGYTPSAEEAAWIDRCEALIADFAEVSKTLVTISSFYTASAYATLINGKITAKRSHDVGGDRTGHDLAALERFDQRAEPIVAALLSAINACPGGIHAYRKVSLSRSVQRDGVSVSLDPDAAKAARDEPFPISLGCRLRPIRRLLAAERLYATHRVTLDDGAPAWRVVLKVTGSPSTRFVRGATIEDAVRAALLKEALQTHLYGRTLGTVQVQEVHPIEERMERVAREAFQELTGRMGALFKTAKLKTTT